MVSFESLMPGKLVATKVQDEGLSFVRDPLVAVEFVEEFYSSDDYLDMRYSEEMLEDAVRDAMWHNMPLTRQMIDRFGKNASRVSD